MRHLQYLKYVIRHKFFVLRAGLWTKAPFYRLLIHDWSKFLPGEWVPYASFFYGDKEKWKASFDRAWLFHQRRNKHHWQYWVLHKDSGEIVPMVMPEKYVREMVADWCGAGRAITGTWEVDSWYQKNKDVIQLNVVTRLMVEKLISDLV